MPIVYTLPSCVQCTATKRRLQARGIEFEVRDLAQDATKAAEFKELGFLTAPIVEYNGDVWGGFNPDKIDAINA